MKLLATIIIVFLCHLKTSAQRVWFIYLQTEPAHPFYVKLNGKTYTSTASGYLILSKLKDSTYTLTVGINQLMPEQKFTISINRKDRGFLIKNFGEKGWGLFDLQSTAIIMPDKNTDKANESNEKGEISNVSLFTEILSKATDDPSLKEKTITSTPKKEEISDSSLIKPITPDEDTFEKQISNGSNQETKTETTDIADTKIHDTISSNDQIQINTEEKLNIGEQKSAILTGDLQRNEYDTVKYQRSLIKRKSESSTTEGFRLVFTDEVDGRIVDIIRILIPNPIEPNAEVTEKSEPDLGRRFLDIPSVDTVLNMSKPVDVKEEAKPQVPKNNCPAVAGENDFLLLRKNMAAQMEDDRMLDEARKHFKKKCFTVLQIRNLSYLFLNDEGKYRFFDFSYAHVSDIENFPSLEKELKDAYYINRFRAMLK